MVDPKWYRTYFDENYLRRYAPHLPADRTALQVDQIVDLLGLEPPSRILDLACGQGRHAIRLAERGYRVTGFDLSHVLLERARADAEAAGVDVGWVEGDMRELPFEGAFDAVLNIFTAFGYLENDEEDQQVVEGVARTLAPGGRFLLETIHGANLVGRFDPYFVERYDDGLLVLHEHALDLERHCLDDRVTSIEPDGTRREQFTRVRLYTVPEFRRLFEAAGLRLVACYGGLDGSELTVTSHRLVLIAGQ